MKKRIFACLLALVFALSLGSFAAAEELIIDPDPAAPEAAEEEEVLYTVEELGYDRDVFTIATFTPLTGKFFTNMWGTGTSDADVKMLLHRYALAEFDVAAGNYLINSVAVEGYQATTVARGNRRYNIFLFDDLYWSDGTKITAYDYAFSILMQLHPETAKAGAQLPDLSYILGAAEYASGKSDVVEGLRVISDTQLQITVKKEALPYFYELSYIAFNPYPIHVIAKDCKVKDDGKGAYIDKAKSYTAAVLRKTVLNERSGYLTHPSVVSGPYKLTSFNGTDAVFERNDYYKGDGDGNKPQFKKIVYKSVDNKDAIPMLGNSEAAIVHKAMTADTIAAGNALAQEKPYEASAYPRSGLSFISFACEQPAVSEKAVRQAIALCLDKEALMSGYVGNTGMVTDGYYGIGQWMYQILSGSMDYPTEDGLELARWQKLSMEGVKLYEKNTQEAADLLENAGWKLNAKGVREKELDGKKVALDLTLLIAEGNSTVDFLKNEFTAALKEAGIILTVKAVPWNELLSKYYRQEKRTNEMFYLATNFDAAFNPAGELNPAESAQGVQNKTGMKNEALYKLAVDMSKTEPGDTLGYCTKWVKFVEGMAEELPVIPVYSNMYFDFYTSALDGYEVSAYISWAQALVAASFQDVLAD